MRMPAKAPSAVRTVLDRETMSHHDAAGLYEGFTTMVSEWLIGRVFAA
jgi:hypothetical protein